MAIILHEMAVTKITLAVIFFECSIECFIDFSMEFGIECSVQEAAATKNNLAVVYHKLGRPDTPHTDSRMRITSGIRQYLPRMRTCTQPCTAGGRCLGAARMHARTRAHIHTFAHTRQAGRCLGAVPSGVCVCTLVFARVCVCVCGFVQALAIKQRVCGSEHEFVAATL